MSFYGGSSGSSSASASSLGNTAVVLGDSLTIGNPTADNSWAYYASILSKGRFNILYNAGISGQNTTSIAARVQSDVIAKKPKICVILAGTNDVLQGVLPATTRTNLESMITALQSANIMPILCTIPPADTTGHQSANDTINFIIRSLATKYRLAVCDFHTPMLNTANGLFNSTYSSDLVHPLPAGAKILGQKFVTDIVPTLPAFTHHMPTVNATTNNLITNGLFATDNWTKTGTGSATSSLVADAAISGNWLEANKTVSDALSNVWTSNAATVVPGKRYIVSGRIQTVGAEAGVLTYALYIGQNANGNIFILTDLTRDVDGNFYYEYTPATGSTIANINLRVSAGTGKVRISQVSIYDATTLGL